MSAAQLERLQEQLRRLRLVKSRERLDACQRELSQADFLDSLQRGHLDHRHHLTNRGLAIINVHNWGNSDAPR